MKKTLATTLVLSLTMFGAQLSAAEENSAPRTEGTRSVIEVDNASDSVLTRTTAGDVEMELPGQTEEQPIDVASMAPMDLVEDVGEVLAATSMNGADVVTYDTSHGEQTLIHITDADAPSVYDFDFTLPIGSQVLASEDGGVDIIDVAGERLGFIKAPWAVDAHGQDVPTRFEIHGTTVRQIVVVSEDTTFPVIADPSTVWGWTVCIATIGATFMPWGAGARIGYRLVARFGSVRRGVQIMWRAYHAAHGARAKYNAAMAASGGLFGEIIGFDSIREKCFT
ncbi:MAG: hypothetical protein Q4G34_00765 [Micrococcus sp.]|nr:hypothetical protein [Micrococcus sp.]